MEFNEKLQQLRKGRGITQEELAAKLYVSRTAISKWESGRGYPNIESIKAIAEFFGVTLDELLSTNEVLDIARRDTKKKQNMTRDLVCGLLDVCMLLLLFLPFFAARTGGAVTESSLIVLAGVQPWLKISYFSVVIAISAMGILTLALQNCEAKAWLKIKAPISLSLSVVAVVLFVASLQPYAAIFTFALLLIKVFLQIKRA